MAGVRTTKVLSFYSFIDRLTVLWLASIFVIVVTALPTVGYLWTSSRCTQTKCNDGLVSQDGGTISLGDAIYFSLVTESTLGYGDIHPHGLSRALACFQVFAGLIFAGITVAKITSLPTRDLRQIGLKARGIWLVMNDLKSQRRGEENIITIAHIEFDGKSINYWGINYTLFGEQCGQFQSSLTGLSEHELQFKYTNGNSSTEHFSQGVTTMTFEVPPTGEWKKYHASARDAARPFPIEFKGWKADPDQCRKIQSGNAEEELSVIKEFIKSHGNKYNYVLETWK